MAIFFLGLFIGASFGVFVAGFMRVAAP